MASLPHLAPLLLLSLLLALAQPKKLIFIQEIFRHGARYPIKQIKNDKSDFASSQRLQGELTAQGKHMHYVLGRAMYDKYWESLFAGSEYLKKYHPSQLYVRSTNFNRTIESAQSHLLGLLETLDPYQLPNSQLNNSLPPFANAKNYHIGEQNETSFNIYGSINTDFHTIPIHTDRQNEIPAGLNYKYRANPYDEGDFLSKYDESNCPNTYFWGKENLLSEDAMKIKSSEKVKTFLSSLSNAVGYQVKYEQSYLYVDNYICEKFMGKDYLPMFNNPQIEKTSDFIMVSTTILAFFYTEDQIKSSNTRLIQSTVHNLKEAMAGRGPRYVIYSAHDTTILSFNSALQLVTLKCVMNYFLDGANNADSCIHLYPSYATNIVVELWEEDNLSHSVKILYNGVPRKIPICGNKQSCPFSEFEKWANNFYIPDPNDTCGIRQQYTKLYIVIGVLSVFIVAFIIISMRSRFKKKMQQKMEEMEEKKGYIENFEEKETH